MIPLSVGMPNPEAFPFEALDVTIKGGTNLKLDGRAQNTYSIAITLRLLLTCTACCATDKRLMSK